MATKDKRIDAYITKAQPFAKPILNHIRKLVHTACPEVTETVKWGFPHFDYKGSFCNMAAFKEHCSFGFWKQSLIKDTHGIFAKEQSAGSLGRITSMKDLPSEKVLLAYIKQAMAINDEGIKQPAKAKITTSNKELVLPDYLVKALAKNKKAQTAFNSFSYSHKKEYVEWLTEAKTEETKQSRLKTAIEWMAEGKSRHWKYARK